MRGIVVKRIRRLAIEYSTQPGDVHILFDKLKGIYSRSRQQFYQAVYQLQGLCIKCAKPRDKDNAKFCRSHIEKERRWMATRRREKGIKKRKRVREKIC